MSVKKYILIPAKIITLIIYSNIAFSAQVFNIKDFGAIGDGLTINTIAIQKAIDKCFEVGGKVIIPAGTFVTGTIYMKSNVNLHIEESGVLKGSPFFKDYPNNEVVYKNIFTHKQDGGLYANKALIFAENVYNISFTGVGTIDGSGDSKEFQLGNDNTSEKSRSRPCMLLIIDSKRIKVSDLNLRNSAYWLQNYLGCENLQLKRLKIFNHSNYNQDGMDIDAKNVLIEDCVIDVDDDGICFKSHDRNRIVENIIVRNCIISSNCNAIKFGTASLGGLRNVSIKNCTIKKASADHIRKWQKNLKFIELPVTVISGIALESVDGGVIEKIRISNIKMTDVQTPIFIVLGNRGRKQVDDNVTQIGKIEDLSIRNIWATSHSKMSSSITAYPGQYVKNVKLKNIFISSMGKGTASEAELVLPENSRAYPENRMYGMVYPASGLFVRHVNNLSVKNLRLETRSADLRSSIVLDDVENIKFKNLKSPLLPLNQALVKIVNAKNVSFKKFIHSPESPHFVKLINTEEAEVKVN